MADETTNVSSTPAVSTPTETTTSTETSVQPTTTILGEQPKTTETPPVTTPTETTPITADQLTIPEGLVMSDEQRDGLLGVLNNAELDGPGRANALLGMAHQLLSAQATASQTEFTNLQTEWKTQSENHPEIGGAKFGETVANIGRLMDQYASPEVRQMMDLTGAGNHPAMLAFLNNIAKDLVEPGSVSGTPAPVKDPLASLYPSMQK